jgi:hypothetical protein
MASATDAALVTCDTLAERRDAMTDAEIARLRMFNQRIAGQRFTQPVDVVRWMGAMQAQDYGQALWAIGLRTDSATVTAIERAIAAREIVRTWPMRGTLHFVAAENVRWMLDLLASRRLAADRSRQKQLELDALTLERCGRLFHEALRGGKRLTRPDMVRLLEDAQISTIGQRGYHILWYLAQTGLICLGPMQGREQTFVLLDEWVPPARSLSREDALARLAACYFASHGPATVEDFAGWSGLTLTDARAGLASARSDLASERKEGKEYWLAQGAPDHGGHDTSDVYLLPGFDEYLLGYRDRGDVLAAAHAERVCPGGNGMFLPMVVVGGRVVGTWKRAVKRTARTTGVAITISPFAELGASNEAIAEAARRFSDCIETPLSSLTVSRGPMS